MGSEEAGAALAQMREERDRIAANLLDLDHSTGFRFLSGGPLHGCTERRWQEAQRDIALLWELFDAYRAVCTAAEEIPARSSRLGDRDLAELTGLLRGPAVALSREPGTLAERSLLESRQERLTMREAVGRMTVAFDAVAELVAEAESAWAVLHPSMEEVERLRTRAERLAGELGGARPEKLERLCGRVEEVGREVRGDPLALTRSSGGPDTSMLDAVRGDLQALVSELEEGLRLRDGYRERARRLAEGIEDLRRRAHDAAEERAQALVRIALPEPEPVVDAAPRLRARLEELDRLRGTGRWTDLARRTADLEEEVAAEGDRVRAAHDAASGLLRRRAELRGRLDAYRARAARLGCAEQDVVAERHRRAHELLWTAPCDLEEAHKAVEDYQSAIRDHGGAMQ